MKTCAQCGASFGRPKGYSARQWDARRLCSSACAKASQTTNVEAKECQRCGSEMRRRRAPGGRLEAPKEWLARNHCSVSCAEGAKKDAQLAADPQHVGTRRLVCRTCKDCHALLPAEKFRQRQSGVREWMCMSCQGLRDRQGMSAERAERVRAQSAGHFAELQTATRARAVRNGMQWTGAEMEILMQHPDTPAKELAVMLGRTYAATCLRRSVLTRGKPA